MSQADEIAEWERILAESCDAAVSLMDDAREATVTILRAVDAHDTRVAHILDILDLSCLESSRAVLLLVLHGFSWDSEVLIRTVLEGTIKYVYISNSPKENRDAVCEEYWIVLGEFADIKMHDRIRAFFQLVEQNGDDPNDPRWKPFHELLLDEQRYRDLRAKYSKHDRKSVENKWSFIPLIEHLARVNDEKLAMLAGFVRPYGHSSHSVHKDGTGVGMMWERKMRPSPRREFADLAHRARIIADVAMFSALRMHFTFCAFTKEKPLNLFERAKELTARLDELHRRFYEIEYEEKS